MDKTPISTALAPAKPAITSQAMRAGDFIFTAGVMPIDPERGALPPGGIGAQTHQAMRNLRALLAAAGTCSIAWCKSRYICATGLTSRR